MGSQGRKEDIVFLSLKGDFLLSLSTLQCKFAKLKVFPIFQLKMDKRLSSTKHLTATQVK